MRAIFVALILAGLTPGGRAQAPAAQSASNPQKTVWYFYRVKWGFQDEFQTLFALNHLPVLREEMKGGRIVSVLEGGYNPPVLAECVALHLEELLRAE